MSAEEQWESITKTVSAAKLEINASIRGKLVALETNKKYPEKQDLIMEDETGAPFTLFTAGTLTYAVRDGDLVVGETYRITRRENQRTNKGNNRTTFEIQRLKRNGSVAAPAQEMARPSKK